MHVTNGITRLIHESLWTVISYAFGQPTVSKFIESHFRGEWKYLNKTICELAEKRADEALLEMATRLRVLDDAEGLNDYFSQTKPGPLGKVIQADDTETDLHFRDLTNKIMHAKSFEWRLSEPDSPKVISHSNNPARWKTAEIDVAKLMALIGGLTH